MTTRVIVHADDFGLHPSINDGVERAYREGLVSSASLMPSGPAFSDALQRLAVLPGLDLGLHFALVGVPGAPPTLGAFLASYVQGKMPAAAIRAALPSTASAGFACPSTARRAPASHRPAGRRPPPWPPAPGCPVATSPPPACTRRTASPAWLFLGI